MNVSIAKRMHLLTLMVITALLSLFVCIGFTSADTAYAQGTGTTYGDPYIMDSVTDGKNPYPDRISDDEIDKYRESKKEMYGGNPYYSLVNTHIFLVDIVLKDGSVVNIYDSRTEFFQANYLQKYGKDITQLRWYVILPKSTDGWDKMAYTFLNHLSLKSNLLSNDEANVNINNDVLTTLQLNGSDLPTNTVYYEWKNGVKANTYFYGSFDVRDEPTTAFRVLSYPVLGSNSSPVGGGTSIEMVTSTMIPTATFHYVDETAYRTLLNLGKTDAIPQRSAGADWSSTAPAESLNITDLKSLKLSDTFNGFSWALRTKDDSIQKPYFSVGDKTFNNYSYSADGTSVEEGAVRPTYEEAKADHPVGYAYIADDIDKPADPSDPANFVFYTDAGKGNYYFTPILHADGTMTYDKHYYLLYRQMPTPISIQKTGPEGEAIPQVKMDLYRVVNGTETLIAKDLTTDASGKVFATDSTTVDQTALSALTADESYDVDLGYITKDGITYLAPGTYKLKETSVPKEYKKADFEINVPAVQDIVSDNTTPVQVQTFTVKNEKAPTYPVSYEFVGPEGKDLPQSILDMLPSDSATYYSGDTITLIQPEKTTIETDEGTWKFEGYNFKDAAITVDESLVKDGKILVTGTWSFTEKTIPKLPIPFLNDQKTTDTAEPSIVPDTSDALLPFVSVITIVVLSSLIVGVISYRKRHQ